MGFWTNTGPYYFCIFLDSDPPPKCASWKRQRGMRNCRTRIRGLPCPRHRGKAAASTRSTKVSDVWETPRVWKTMPLRRVGISTRLALQEKASRHIRGIRSSRSQWCGRLAAAHRAAPFSSGIGDLPTSRSGMGDIRAELEYLFCLSRC